jgi:hypothetical protein
MTDSFFMSTPPEVFSKRPDDYGPAVRARQTAGADILSLKHFSCEAHIGARRASLRRIKAHPPVRGRVYAVARSRGFSINVLFRGRFFRG